MTDEVYDDEAMEKEVEEVAEDDSTACLLLAGYFVGIPGMFWFFYFTDFAEGSPWFIMLLMAAVWPIMPIIFTMFFIVGILADGIPGALGL